MAVILGDTRPRFLSKLLSGQAPQTSAARLGPALVETVLAGGYPETLARSAGPKRWPEALGPAGRIGI